MSAVALYTFGVLDPMLQPDALADLADRGLRIFNAAVDAPGFLGHADGGYPAVVHSAGADVGLWGSYVLPLGLPDFAGHDPAAHIATLSHWRDVSTARGFVYRGLHRSALQRRNDWFVRGPWPGHVLWPVGDASTPHWSEGVNRLEALAGEGESAEHFTFHSLWGRA